MPQQCFSFRAYNNDFTTRRPRGRPQRRRTPGPRETRMDEDDSKESKVMTLRPTQLSLVSKSKKVDSFIDSYLEEKK